MNEEKYCDICKCLKISKKHRIYYCKEEPRGIYKYVVEGYMYDGKLLKPQVEHCSSFKKKKISKIVIKR